MDVFNKGLFPHEPHLIECISKNNENKLKGNNMPQIYSNVKPVVDEFIKNNPDLNEALKNGLAQVDKESKNLYLLAFMQNVIS